MTTEKQWTWLKSRVSRGGRGWDVWREEHGNRHDRLENRQPMGICWMPQGTQTGALWQSRREGWGGKFPREGAWVSLWLLLVDVWQKTAKSCKASILQLINKVAKKQANKQTKKTLRKYITGIESR